MRDALHAEFVHDETIPHETRQNEELLERLREELLARPSDCDALKQAGGLLFEMGRFEEAAAHLAKAVSSGRLNQDAHFDTLMQLADCYEELQKWDSARKYWQAASALSPDKAQPHVRLGTLAFQRGQLDQAERLFRVAGKLQEDCGEAYGGLAMICQHRGDHSGAFEMYLKCLELDTDNLVALLGLFQTSCRMGSFSKIIHYLEVYLENNPSDASVLFCLASLYAREGRLWRARQAVRKVLKEAPEKQDAKNLLAELEEALGDEDSGVDARL